MNYRSLIESNIDYHKQLLNKEFEDKLTCIGKVIVNSLQSGGKLLIAGNGGSAADAQHFAAELIGRFMKERRSIAAIALTADSAILTSLANDYDYHYVFSRQVEALAKKEDIVFVISSSGNSENLIAAVKTAKKMGIKTIGLLGKDGGLLKNECDENLTILGDSTARIQEVHIFLIHMLCQMIEEDLFENE